MNFISFEQLSKTIYVNIAKVPTDVDLIIGIPRSGTLAANLLALYMNKPFMDIKSLLRREELSSGNTRKCSSWIKSVDEAKHILIVDDSISSGKAIREAKQKIKEGNVTCKVTYLAIYALRATCKLVDIYFEICEQPRMFEWNYMHHWALEYMYMDIDGVLCEDPSFIQNDDGNRYRNFLLHATPKIIPTQKVGKLISGRIEKYRGETERWLKEQGVEYGELVLLPATSLAEGRTNYNHAEFKAEQYRNSNAILFIESNYEQAVEICRISKRPVFCVANKQLITSENIIKNMQNIRREWKITVKRIIKKLLKKIDYVK